MALTIITQPQTYHAAYHPVVFKVSSTLIGQDEFKYLFKIISTPFTRTIKVSPRPVDGQGYIDIRRHVQDILDAELFDIKEEFTQEGTSAAYTMQIIEQYKDGSGNIIEETPVSVSGLVGLNTIFNRNDYLTYDESDYKLTGVNSKMLWSIENNLQILKDDLFFIHFTIPSASQFLRFVIEEFFANGTTNTVLTTINADRVNIHTFDLAAKLTDPDNTVKVDVWFTLTDLTQVSEKRTFFLKDPCSIYRRHRIIYLDSKGSRSSLNFDQVSNQTTQVQPKTYQKFIDISQEDDTSRALTRFFVLSDEVFNVNSAILSDKHNSMIRELIKSTDVWLDVRNDDRFPSSEVEFVPIEILTKNFKDSKSENQQLLQQQIQYRYAYEDVTR